MSHLPPPPPTGYATALCQGNAYLWLAGVGFGFGHVTAFSGSTYRFDQVGRFWITRGRDFSMQAETTEVTKKSGNIMSVLFDH